MNVKEFVKESISQIIIGLDELQNDDKLKRAVVVPYHSNRQEVEFDIAVTAVEGKETGGKAGISVWSIGAGVSGKSESTNSTLSRIKFSVPMELPKGSERPINRGPAVV